MAVVALVVVVVVDHDCAAGLGIASCEDVSGGHDLADLVLFAPKEGHHNPVKIEPPRLDAVVTNDPRLDHRAHGDRKSYAIDELLCDKPSDYKE